MHKPKAESNEIIENILNLNFDKSQPDFQKPVFNPEEGFEPTFQILKDYYQKYKYLEKKGELDKFK